MPAPSNPPYKAEHIGSLLRPQKLLDKRHAVYEDGESKDGLRPLEEESIRAAVKMQQDCGFHTLADGEYGRLMFWGTWFPSLQGMTEIFDPDVSLFREYAPDMAAFMEKNHQPAESVICTGKIRHSGTSTYVPELRYLQSILPESEWPNIKLTLCAPNWYHFRYKEGKAYPSDVYANDDEYFADIAAAYRTELDLLYKAGLRNAQVDDPNLAYFCDEKMLSGWAADPLNKIGAEEQLDAYIRFYNSCFERPADFHLGIHLCRGNFVNSRHFSEGAYDRIAKKLFQDLDVPTYYLEYDTPRAGGFEPLKYLPRDKVVVLGVVTSKFPKLEDKRDMIDRIHKAADYVAEGAGQTREEALQRLSISPQCGFASHADGNSLAWEDMVAKLKLVRSIADEVWPGQP